MYRCPVSTKSMHANLCNANCGRTFEGLHRSPFHRWERSTLRREVCSPTTVASVHLHPVIVGTPTPAIYMDTREGIQAGSRSEVFRGPQCFPSKRPVVGEFDGKGRTSLVSVALFCFEGKASEYSEGYNTRHLSISLPVDESGYRSNPFGASDRRPLYSTLFPTLAAPVNVFLRSSQSFTTRSKLCSHRSCWQSGV